MEEVWEDITLSSLQPQSHHRLPRAHQRVVPSPAITLQDFLAGPPRECPGPPPPPPHRYSDDRCHKIPIDLNLDLSPNSLGTSSPSITPHACFCPKKRLLPVGQQQQRQPTSDGLTGSGDCASGGDDEERRHNKMIKNRDSAARSRARKQAHANELERELSHLAQENARLRIHYEELRMAVAAQIPARRRLQRASSAPLQIKRREEGEE